MTRSLLSALIGWLVCCVIFAVLYLLDGGWPALQSVAPFLALVSGVVIFLVWLCLLWPLYCLVPRRRLSGGRRFARGAEPPRAPSSCGCSSGRCSTIGLVDRPGPGGTFV